LQSTLKRELKERETANGQTVAEVALTGSLSGVLGNGSFSERALPVKGAALALSVLFCGVRSKCDVRRGVGTHLLLRQWSHKRVLPCSVTITALSVVDP
jgi:hypothetical protein